MRSLAACSVVAFVLAGCGAQVVLEDDGGSGGSESAPSTGANGSMSTTKATTSTAGSSSAGLVPCDDHADCGNNPGTDVCVFSGGFCAQTCGPASPPCPPNTVCEFCATASCPTCKNCMGACIPN